MTGARLPHKDYLADLSAELPAQVVEELLRPDQHTWSGDIAGPWGSAIPLTCCE
jgi:hypothetical protein